MEGKALWKVFGTDVKTICNVIGSGLGPLAAEVSASSTRMSRLSHNSSGHDVLVFKMTPN